MAMTDETLMAYADGQLSGEDAAAVDRAIAADPALATRVAQLADACQAVRQAFGAPAPVSAGLQANVLAMIAADTARRGAGTAPASNVVDLASRRKVVPLWQVPMAAMLALAVGAGSVWLGTRNEAVPGGLQVASLTEPAVAGALNSLASGESSAVGDGITMSLVASFRDDADRLCREFEQTSASGDGFTAVACRTDATWDLRFAVVTPPTDAGSYAPASSLVALDAYLSATGAGAPLSAEDEAAALQKLP